MTNKIEELNKELDELQAKINEVQKKIEEAKQAEWPKRGDKYWYMFGTGEIFDDRWCEVSSDKARQSIGNAFKTEEEAEFELERLKVIAELKKFAMTREEVNTARNEKSVYTLAFVADDKIDVYSYFTARVSDLYFESDKIAREAINAVGKDRIKKYYFRAEE